MQRDSTQDPQENVQNEIEYDEKKIMRDECAVDGDQGNIARFDVLLSCNAGRQFQHFIWAESECDMSSTPSK